jgi:hypothetical protein
MLRDKGNAALCSQTSHVIAVHLAFAAHEFCYNATSEWFLASEKKRANLGLFVHDEISSKHHLPDLSGHLLRLCRGLAQLSRAKPRCDFDRNYPAQLDATSAQDPLEGADLSRAQFTQHSRRARVHARAPAGRESRYGILHRAGCE